MRKQFVIKFLVICAAAFIIAVFLSGELATRSSNKDIGNPPDDLAIDTVSFEDASGRTVKGWAINGDNGRGTMLLLHGWHKDRRYMVQRARFLSRTGYSILMIDLMAHGESLGERITFGYLEAESVSAAVDFAKSRWPGEKLGIIGVSLGGSAAVFSSIRARADAYILEGAYSSLRDTVENRWRSRMGPLGYLFVPALLWQVPIRLGFEVDDLSTVDQISKLDAPVFIIAGDEDKKTTLANSRALFENAKQPKSLWVLAGAQHENFHLFSGDEYERRVLAFLDQYLH